MGRHLAFKCTYNDGGEGDLVGFNGICSLDNIKRNIKNKRVRCNHPECPCKQYYDRGFTGSQPNVSSPPFCYESSLFRDWRFGAGFSQLGPKKIQPRRIAYAEVRRVAILTTRFPEDHEIDRKIIGLFRIGEVRSDEETIVIADEKHRVRLPLEEARELYFWNYYQSENAAWNRHLFKYLTDAQVARIVRDVQETVRDEHTRDVLGSLLQQVWGSDDVPPASGPRAKMYPRHIQRVAAGRKYGPTGEGSEHKRLKEWLANNPAQLGYEDVVEVTLERVFRSGDCADIVWRCKDGRYVVVEVETYFPEPGAYQALKYRCLLCAEMGLELTSPNVEAWVVAREIPESLRALCTTYGIRFEEIE